MFLELTDVEAVLLQTILEEALDEALDMAASEAEMISTILGRVSSTTGIPREGRMGLRHG